MPGEANCIFCRLLAGQAEASFVHRDDCVAAFMALPQAGRGHVLIIPVEHHENAYDLPLALTEPIFLLAIRMARAVKRALQPDGVTLVQNSERGANQTVMHFHLHVIGRLAGERLSIHSPSGLADRPTLDELAARIGRALSEEPIL